MLLSVFLFSTIGVPVTLHYCQMMNSVSLQSCGMCEKESSDCCKDDNYGTTINSVENGFCCDTKFIAEPSSEKYISSSYEVQKIEYKILIFVLPLNEYLYDVVSNTTFTSDTSPPLTHSNAIYLNNSAFLI